MSPGSRNCGTRSRQLNRIVLDHGGDERVYRARIDQWLITLHIDVNLGGQVRGNLRHAVGSRAMVGARDDRFAAEGFDGSLDPGVFGGDHNP